MGRPRLNLLELFSKVEKPVTGCWEWPFTRCGKDRRAYFRGHPASRQLHELLIGPIPPKLDVLHSCDNPGCVRPDHWFLGDQKKNIADAMAKGRFVHNSAPPGEDHPSAKLKMVDVINIREKYAAGGIFMHELAARYSISTQQISKIVNRQRWAS